MFKKIIFMMLLITPVVYLCNKAKRGLRKEKVAMEKIYRDMRKEVWR